MAEQHLPPILRQASLEKQAAVIRREDFPSLIKDTVRGTKADHVILVLDLEIALQVAQDLELAIEKSPGLGYGPGS